MTNTSIPFPKRMNEFELHCNLYMKLKRIYERKGYRVRAEVSGKNGLKLSRFDIVIFFDKHPLVIIEVKKNRASFSAKQLKEYSKYNVPLIYCNNKSDIPNVMQALNYHFSKLFSSKVIMPS